MKGQDILLLLKLLSLERQALGIPSFLQSKLENWQDWEDVQLVSELAVDEIDEEHFGSVEIKPSLEDGLAAQLSLRALSATTGISKSEVSQILARCYQSGLAKQNLLNGQPKVNASALQEFLLHGIRYVFPVQLQANTRGIATAWAAPVLQDKLMSTSALSPVWPDAYGKTSGPALKPLFKSVPFAVRQDAHLYALLALVDSIRTGQPRERKIASENLVRLFRERE